MSKFIAPDLSRTTLPLPPPIFTEKLSDPVYNTACEVRAACFADVRKAKRTRKRLEAAQGS